MVVGGGFGGLITAATALHHHADIEVTVLEAASQPGGVLRSEQQGGFTFEHGPLSLPVVALPEPRPLAVGAPASTALAGPLAPWLQRLGLAGELEQATAASSQRLLFDRGRLIPWSLERRSLLAQRALPPLARWRAASGLRWPSWARFGPPTERSLRAFLTEHLGSAAGELMAELQLLELGAADPEEVSAAATFPRWGLLEARHGSLLRALERSRSELRGAPLALRGGNGRLIAALQQRLGSRLRCSARVQHTAREGGLWRLQLSDSTAIEADALVLALGAAESAHLLTPVEPELAALLAAQPTSSMLGVHLGYRRSALPMPLLAGAIDLPRRSGRRARVIGFPSALYPSRAPEGGATLRVLFELGEGLEGGSDAAWVELARAEVAAVLGAVAEPVAASVSRWPNAFPRYPLGHGARTRRLRELALRSEGRLALVGSYLSGVGLADVQREAELAVGQLFGVLRV